MGRVDLRKRTYHDGTRLSEMCHNRKYGQCYRRAMRALAIHDERACGAIRLREEQPDRHQPESTPGHSPGVLKTVETRIHFRPAGARLPACPLSRPSAQPWRRDRAHRESLLDRSMT